MRTTIATLAAAAMLALAPPASAAQDDAALNASLQKAVDGYVAARAKPEHISAISVCVALKGAPCTSFVAGTKRYPNAGPKVVPADLFEIGSITKSFTSVAILHLEAQGKLTIEDPLGKWLPQYPAWKNVKIRTLLDMTSPIPTYDGTATIGDKMGNDPNHKFTPQELVAAAYPHNGVPKPVSGWTYSNTNYVLSQLIVEKASGKPYADVVRDVFGQVGLKSTYYEQFFYPAAITDRMVSGYFFNTDPGNEPLKPLLGHDVRTDSVSWMQGAGGIVSSPADVAAWARALYEGPLLADKQRRELETVVSMKTGKPIAAASDADPLAFGLGVGQGHRPGLGTFWFYQGETLGYRVLYGYFPKSGAVIVIALNSQPPEKQNENGKLMQQLYGILEKAGKLSS